MKYRIIFILIAIIFAGCAGKPDVVIDGSIRSYELGGREPCLDLIVNRNSVAKNISTNAINIKEKKRLSMFKIWYKKLSPLDGSDAVKRCKFTNNDINYHGEILQCQNYKDLVIESKKCLTQDSSILVNPFVNLRVKTN